VSSQDNRRLFACYAEERCGTARIGLSDSPILYWITSNYGVSTLSLDDGGTFRQPISTQHLEATTGMFFCAVVCVCVCVCVQCLVFLFFILIAVASDSILPVSRLCEVVPYVACIR